MKSVDPGNNTLASSLHPQSSLILLVTFLKLYNPRNILNIHLGYEKQTGRCYSESKDDVGQEHSVNSNKELKES